MHPFLYVAGKGIPVYGLCMVIGLGVVSVLSGIRSSRRNLSSNDLIIYLACITGTALLGAKVLYCLSTFGLKGCFQLIRSGSGSILLSDGGFVFYGGLIGGLMGVPIAQRMSNTEPGLFSEVIAPVIPIGHAIGRIGCFFAGCCYGRPYEGIGAVRFPHSIDGLSPDVSVIPIQLIEAIINLLLFYYLIREERRGNSLIRYIKCYALIRFGLEFLRGDSIRGHYLWFSTSQWVSIVLLICCEIICLKTDLNSGLFRKQS